MKRALTLVSSISFVLWAVALWILLGVPPAEAKTVRYELAARRQSVNLSGKKEVDFALTLNGGIPAPTLTFTEGDDAEIVLRNELPGEELSVHWHGILLPPEMDGVPYVNTPPIFPGKEFTFRFKVRQNGTYWYHSHTGVQEQKGVYGAIVIHPREKKIQADREAVLVLSDWSDEDANQILRNLRKDGEYYTFKKNTMRSYWGAIRAGKLGTQLHNEWTRMGGMDLSDVGYDAFLINGKRDLQLLDAKPGERIRLRVINAAASSYFYVRGGAGALRVVSADGQDTEPLEAKEFLIGMAETYDILFTVPPARARNYEIRAIAQDGTGQASAWVGDPAGEKVRAQDRPAPDLYASMDHAAMGHEATGHGSSADHSSMNHGSKSDEHGDHSDHGASKVQDPSAHSAHSTHADHADQQSTAIETATVDALRAPAPTAFDPAIPRTELKLVLGGDMNRYVWHINGKAISQDRTIPIREGEIIRFKFVNDTMMHHPMHLHGHFFRVINPAGERSPLKHTVDVPPHGERTIEFLANEPGEWMLHCHNLYHLKTGMARVVKYLSYQPKPEIARWQPLDPHLHDHLYATGSLEAATNQIQANLRLTQTWQMIEMRVEARKDDDWEGEGDAFYRRYFGQYFSVLGGGETFENRESLLLGASYVLPFLVEVRAFLSHRTDYRFDLSREFQWAKFIVSEVEARFRHDEETEIEASLMFRPAWSWAAGLRFTNHSVGVGAVVQF